MGQRQSSNINLNEAERLCLNGSSQNINIVSETSIETKNLNLEKLSLMNFEERFDLVRSNAIPNITLSLKAITMINYPTLVRGTVHNPDLVINSTLTKLTLSNCKTSSLKQATIIDSIMQVQTPIRKLKLIDLRIKKNEAESIVRALENVQLIKLSFDGCYFQEDTLVLILKAIENSSLRTLKLVALSVNDEKIVALTDCIKRSKLIKLSLRHVTCTIEISPETKMAALIMAIQKSLIQTLDIRHSSTFRATADIIDTIKHSRITKFKFYKSHFSTKDIMKIMDTIRGNTAFRNISLRSVMFTDQLFINMCDLIEHSSVTHLDLSYCDLSIERMLTVIESVKRSSIYSLNLSTNYFDNRVALAMHDLLENHNLRKINIEGVSIEILLGMLPSINRSRLTKFVRCSREHAHVSWDKTKDDNMWADIKKYAKEQKYILKNSHKMKSARHV